jgi:hypothetical protein
MKNLIFNSIRRTALIVALAVVAVSFLSCDEESNDNNLSLLALAGGGGGITFLTTGGSLIGEYNRAVVIQDGATVTLNGQVKFNSGAALIIGPGATIKATTGLGSGVSSNLIIDRGAKIFCYGTAAQPIVFTSDKTAGTRAPGDWGGITIHGNATANVTVPARTEFDSGLYGGTDDSDNSGYMKYVRIEFAGFRRTDTKEYNSLSLFAVGSGTTIDYIHAHKGQDDGVEMFGGTVNIKHIVVTAGGDDGIDCTEGWRGKLQFAVVVRGNDAGADHTLEWETYAPNPDVTPLSDVTAYNLTLISNADRACHMKGGIKATLRNVYVANTTDDQGWVLESAPALVNKTNVNLDNAMCENCGGDTFDLCSQVSDATFTLGGDVSWTDAPGTPYINYAAIDTSAEMTSVGAAGFVPQTGAGVAAATPPNDGFFDTSADFIGAIENSAGNWASGWTSFPAN